MKFPAIIRPLVVLLLLLGSLTAQIEKAAKWKDIFPATTNLKVGDEITIAFEVTLDNGYHIYSAKQPADVVLPAILALDKTSTGVKLLGGLTETGKREEMFDEIFGAKIALFHKKATFFQKLKITGEKVNIEGALSYQVCDDQRCVPGDRNFKITFTAAKGEKASEKAPEKTSGKAADMGFDSVPGDEINPHDRFKAAQTWQKRISPTDGLKIGDVVTVTFQIKLKPEFHIFSVTEPKSPANLPTTFRLRPTAKGVKLRGGLSESGNAIKKFDETYGTDVSYFEEEMTFSQQLELTAANALIDAAVHYQICDIATCVVDSQDVHFEIRHSEAAATSAVLNAPNDASVAAADTGCGNQDLWRLFLLCLGAGFIAVLTPCVFPMVPLTVSIFTKRGSPTRAQGIRNALSYSLSIIAIYTLLGILLSVLFGANILRDIANNPWFNLAFFALLVIFGLSFLGLFELTLPSSWSTKFTQQGSKGGFMGTFFLAMALAVVSFACTGPLVATALISAADGSCFSSPIIAMLGFSTGLAFPFGFLAFAPNLLRKMPKSGNWMNTVKVTLGLLEIGFALTYLSGADLVSHWGLLDREIFLAIWIVIAFVLGFNLLGKLPIGHVEPEYDEMGSVIQNPPVSVARLLMGGTALVFMLYLIPGLWGAPLPMINGFLPPVNKDMGTVVIGGGASSNNEANDICNAPKKYAEISEHTPPGFCAFYDLEEGLAYAKAHKKPVFLDFTGFNCKNCRYVEGISWVDAAARQMLTNNYVMISLFTDDAAKLDEMKVLADGTKLRTRGNIWLEYQKKTFNQNSSPYYVLMDADQRVFAQMGYDGSGEAFTPTFVNFLKDGLKQANAQL